jgi:arylsulfatase A-like enzyme
MASSRIAVARYGLWLVLVAWASACGDAPPGRVHPVYRLVDLVSGVTRLSDLPTRRIGDETRYVLPTYPAIPIEPVTGREVFEIRQALPADVSDVSRAVVVGRYQWEGTAHDIGPRVAAVRSGAGSRLEIDLSLPEPPDEEVLMLLRASGVPDGPVVRTETEALAVPDGAQLDFAMGIDALAWEQPAVTFEVQVCEGDECTSVFRETLDPADAEGRQWQPRRVALDRWGGREARVRFDVHVPSDDAEAFSLPYWANPTIQAPGPVAPDAWNLILVSLDTLGANHLPSFGYPRATAPFLDGELSERGTMFANCFTAAPTTGPSHMTAFTSLQPSVHGLTGNLVFKRIMPATLTLAGLLRQAGFETGAVTEDGPLGAMHGFARGFNSYSENRDTEGKGHLGFVDRTLDDGRRWLARHGDSRFFLFLHTFQVHTPYQPPDGYGRYFPDLLPGEDRVPPVFRPTLYDREIRYLDDQLRAFFDDLEEMGIWRNTLLVIMSDHGEAFLEHGFLFHGGVLHDEVLRVPLLVVGPGIAAGRRIETAVSLLDLTPTILDWLGLPAPDGMMGRNVAAAARGPDSVETSSDRAIFSETWTPLMTRMTADGIKSERREHPAYAVRKDGRKLIRRGPADARRYWYYDLRRDPDERDDLYVRDPEAAADLRALLEAYEASMVEMREVRAAADGLSDLPAEPIDPERLEKLRALGYIE